MVLCSSLLNNNGGVPQSTPLFLTYIYMLAAVYDLRHFLASSQPSTTDDSSRPIDHMRDDVTFLATVNALLGSHFEWIRNGEELLCCRLF